MLSCVTRNQIFRCSLLPLSLMCECWIVKFTARCPLRCGTQESTGVSAFTAARGDKCLSFQKVYHRAVNKNQQSLRARHVQYVGLILIQKHHILWSQFHKYTHVIQHFPQVIFRRQTHNPQKTLSHILQLTELCHREYFQQWSASYL